MPGPFLVFDEADSLLADRPLRGTVWEVSQVNEMLTWMENHPLPFACTTNFAEHLDRATLRRFVFKVALDYLTPEQVDAAFQSFFAFASARRAHEPHCAHPWRLRGGAPAGGRTRSAGGPGGPVGDAA